MTSGNEYRIVEWRTGYNESHDDTDHEAVGLAAIGKMGAGKTCFLFRLLRGEFDDKRVSTVSVDYQLKFVMSGHPEYVCPTRTVLKDTIGDSRAWHACAAHLKNVSGIFVCFDSSDPDSFDECRTWIEKLRSDNSYAECLLVGLKADLYEAQPEGQRWMDSMDMQKTARDMGCSVGFCLVSAKTNSGVAEAFVRLVDAALDAERKLSDEVGQSNIKRGKGRTVNLAQPGRATGAKKPCCGGN